MPSDTNFLNFYLLRTSSLTNDFIVFLASSSFFLNLSNFDFSPIMVEIQMDKLTIEPPF